MSIGDFIEILKTVFLLFVCASIIAAATGPKKTFAVVHSRWHYTFVGLELATKDFYTAVTEEIQAKSLPHVRLDIVKHSESGMLSSSREYLQVIRHNQMTLICCAEFAGDKFVSYWYGEPSNRMDDFIERLPYVGKYLINRKKAKTFYQMDTDDMYKDAVKECVMAVIDRISNAKGYRLLSEHERASIDSRYALNAF